MTSFTPLYYKLECNHNIVVYVPIGIVSLYNKRIISLKICYQHSSDEGRTYTASHDYCTEAQLLSIFNFIRLFVKCSFIDKYNIFKEQWKNGYNYSVQKNIRNVVDGFNSMVQITDQSIDKNFNFLKNDKERMYDGFYLKCIDSQYVPFKFEERIIGSLINSIFDKILINDHISQFIKNLSQCSLPDINSVISTFKKFTGFSIDYIIPQSNLSQVETNDLSQISQCYMIDDGDADNFYESESAKEKYENMKSISVITANDSNLELEYDNTQNIKYSNYIINKIINIHINKNEKKSRLMKTKYITMFEFIKNQDYDDEYYEKRKKLIKRLIATDLKIKRC